MKKITVFIFMCSTVILMVGCQLMPAASPSPVETLPPVESSSELIVEGRLVPLQYVNLSFNMAGKIIDVFAKEGEQVKAGQVLARLDLVERLSASVASAELEVVLARLDIKTLQENSKVITAAALQAVASARDNVREAERYLENLRKGGRQTDIDSASANVVLLKDRLDQAEEDFASYENKPEDNLTRARYLSRLADAQRKYDDAVRWLNNLQGDPSDIDLAIAEANLFLAQARLALAELDYTDVQSGPDPDDLESAQSRLQAAESALTAAKAAQADAELVAPFSGTVVQMELKTGEQVIPGRLALVLADFSQWKVETDDLNEMEIPSVAVDQSVTVTPDALPELNLVGFVESISHIYEEKFGDITYTTHILLQQTDPRLRWGMTVSVRFGP